MPDTRTPIMTAVFERLTGAVDVPVFSDFAAIPEGTQPPLVLIEDITGGPGAKGGSALASIVIAIVAQDASMGTLNRLMGAVSDAITAAPLAYPGFEISSVWAEGDDATTGLDVEGLAKVGRVRFGLYIRAISV